MPATPRPCKEAGCPFPAMKQRQRCGWHVLAREPITRQAEAAERRLAAAQARPGFVHRARMPAEQWPAGARWCAGCQSFVPLFYVRGSRCLACARAGARASHVRRTYGLDGDEERALHRWQGGRCFVCGRRATTRELAVDHDHVTGAVRGLLCSDDTFGCNVTLRRLLGDLDAARRLVAYVEKWPLQRMRDGEPPVRYGSPPAAPATDPPPF